LYHAKKLKAGDAMNATSYKPCQILVLDGHDISQDNDLMRKHLDGITRNIEGISACPSLILFSTGAYTHDKDPLGSSSGPSISYAIRIAFQFSSLGGFLLEILVEIQDRSS
jgi:hypothetical protein